MNNKLIAALGRYMMSGFLGAWIYRAIQFLLPALMLLASAGAWAVPPTVSMLIPATNITLPGPVASIPLTASTADSDGTITQVQFFDGATLLGTGGLASGTTSNGTFRYNNWTNVAVGTHVITAVATDNTGASTTSASITITVNPNVAPTVSMFIPATNITLPGPVASIPLTASIADSDGTVTQVQFFDGATLLGNGGWASGTTSNGTFRYNNWTNVAVGTHVITAVATDNTGGTTTSAPITVTVNPNVVPTVSMFIPATNITLPGPVASIPLTASVADSDGTITQVQFFDGSTLLGNGGWASGTTSNGTFRYNNWTNVAVGTHVITAVATDNTGGTTTSAPITITVNPNVVPTATIQTPAASLSLPGPVGNVDLIARATDSDGSVVQVQFFDGSTLIGTGGRASGNGTDGTYRYPNWNNVAVGTHIVTAVATDNTGGTTTSAPITITVNPNVAPTATIQTPAASLSLPGPVGNVDLIARATDSDGSVVQVQFFNGSTLIGTGGRSSGNGSDGTYRYPNWNNVAVGTYVVTAVATDNTGGTTTSAPITVTVTAPSPPAGLYFIDTDHLGTPRLVENQSQQPVWKWDAAEAFGDSVPNENPASSGTFVFNIRFPGQYRDVETGTSYNNFRDYDSTTGKYVQSDLIGLAAGLNTYSYVGGNPIAYKDPSGLFCVSSSDGYTTCVSPAGPVFKVPTPPEFPKTLGDPLSNEPSYHSYDVRRAIGCADPEKVMQAIINSPTPGSPKPSTPAPRGTTNNAVVLGQPNYVQSYLTHDLLTGAPISVNIAGSLGLFGPGYVARWVQEGVAHTAGEGLNPVQAPGYTGRTFQSIGNEALWGAQMAELIKQCGCK